MVIEEVILEMAQLTICNNILVLLMENEVEEVLLLSVDKEAFLIL